MLFLCFFYGCKKEDFNLNQVLTVTPYDALNATIKKNIINYFQNIATNDSLIVGQNIGHADGSMDMIYFNALQQKPALLGVDLGYDDVDRDYSYLLSIIEQHWNSGGLITISSHMPNPHNRKDVKDLENFDYSSLYTEGTQENKRFKILLSNIANIFQKLKDKNIVALWRPLHEMNGGWFWWGNGKKWPRQDEFSKIWEYMYSYFYTTRQLDNLLWVYGPNYQYSDDLKEVTYYYPGNNFVDIVGIDYYGDDLNSLNDHGSFDKLKSLGKPVGICEIGPKNKIDGSFDNQTYLGLLGKGISYFLVWHSWSSTKMALKDCSNPSSLLLNSKIKTLGSFTLKN